MTDARSDDRGVPRAEQSFLAIDPEGKLALDDDPGLLLRVLMLMHVGRSGRDLVAGQRHPLTVLRAPLPATDRLDLDRLVHGRPETNRSRRRASDQAGARAADLRFGKISSRLGRRLAIRGNDEQVECDGTGAVRDQAGVGPGPAWRRLCGPGSVGLVEDRRLISHADAQKVLRRVGYPPERIEEVLAHLPDPIDIERDANALDEYGVSRASLIDRMGGSP